MVFERLPGPPRVRIKTVSYVLKLMVRVLIVDRSMVGLINGRMILKYCFGYPAPSIILDSIKDVGMICMAAKQSNIVVPVIRKILTTAIQIRTVFLSSSQAVVKLSCPRSVRKLLRIPMVGL